MGKIGGCPWRVGASLGIVLNNLPAMLETQVGSLGWEDPLEEGMATHASILVCKNPTDSFSFHCIELRVCSKHVGL